MIRTGHSKYILVIGVELLTKITNWSDRSTCVLFGDGAGASVVGPSENGSSGLLGHHIASDGKGASMLYIPAGGSKMPASRETVEKNLHVLFMRGNEIYKTAINTMSQSCRILLEREGLTPQDVDLFVFHQANLRILEAVGRRLGVSPDRVFVNIHKYGKHLDRNNDDGRPRSRPGGQNPAGFSGSTSCLRRWTDLGRFALAVVAPLSWLPQQTFSTADHTGTSRYPKRN